jgi:hypothetical protein
MSPRDGGSSARARKWLGRLTQALGGIDGFTQNLVSQRRLDAVAQHEIDMRHAEDGLEVVLGAGQVEEPDRTPVELHQDVHIAGGCRFVSDYGPEQGQGRDAELGRELRAMGASQ